MEETIQILIYIHAFFGGLGLLAGIASIVAKKGSGPHKKMGKLFSLGMLSSALISIPISWLPKHQNLFLFLIGVFTIYLVLSGNRALKYRSRSKAALVDQLISGAMFLFSILMIGIGVYTFSKAVNTAILYVFFGAFGLFFSWIDYRFYQNPIKTQAVYLVSHIRKMNGAFIASVTAFLVAGLGFMHLAFWIAPSVLGTFYIIYWRKKVEGKGTGNR